MSEQLQADKRSEPLKEGNCQPESEHQMPTEENENGENESSEEENAMSPEAIQELFAKARSGQAVTIGIDMTKKASELVLDQHWTPDISDADLLKVAEEYDILVDEEPETPETNSSERTPDLSGTNERRELHTGGPSLPDVGRAPTPREVAERTYRDMLSQGASSDDAQVAALDAMLKLKGQLHAVDRIRAQGRDEELASQLSALIDNQ